MITIAHTKAQVVPVDYSWRARFSGTPCGFVGVVVVTVASVVVVMLLVVVVHVVVVVLRVVVVVVAVGLCVFCVVVRRGKEREKEEGADEHKPDCCMERSGEERERKRERGGCR